jgi:hypothetical protein
MVLAYCLKRQIEQRPIICAKRNDYFLTASEPLPVGEARVLATLDGSKIALVRVFADSGTIGTDNCQNNAIPSAASPRRETAIEPRKLWPGINRS